MPHLGDQEAAISAYAGAIGIGVLAAHALVAAILGVLAQRLGTARGGPWRWVVWAPIAALLMPMLGVALTVLGLVAAFGDVGSAPASERAAVLARGISEAMNATALSFGLAWAIYLVTAIAIVVGRLTTPAHPTKEHPARA